MNSRIFKISIFVLILIFFSLLFFHKIKLTTDDLGRHIKNGEMVLRGDFDVLFYNFYSYSEPGNEFINHHWLSGVIFYLIYAAAGFGGLVVFKIIVLLAAFVLLFLTALKKANFWLVALFSLPVILVMGGRSDVRPEIFSYLFLAVFLYLFIDFERHPEKNRIFWLVLLELLWVNLHIYFILGIFLAAGFLAEKIFLERKNNWIKQPAVKKLALLFVLVVIVCFLNPNLVKGFAFPLNIFKNASFQIMESQSFFEFLSNEPTWKSVSAAIYFPMIIFLAFSFIPGFWRKLLKNLNFGFKKNHSVQGGNREAAPIFYFLASVGSAASGFFLIRNLPLFAMIFLPAASLNFQNLFLKIKNRIVEKVFFAVLLITSVFMIFLALQNSLFKEREPGIGLARLNNEPVEFFKENNLKGPIFNDLDIGGYLIFNFFPEEKPFIDNRFESYTLPFLTGTYVGMIADEKKWEEVLAKYNFNVIFFHLYDDTPRVRNFLSSRMRDPGWALVYADIYSVIFLRNAPANHAVIEQFKINPENMAQKLEFLTISPYARDQIAAADLFNLAGRFDLAMATFLEIVERWPEKGRIWMILGQMELSKAANTADLNLAKSYLQTAINKGHKTAETYAFLGWAYYRSGELGAAKSFLKKALSINPNRQDAKDLLAEVQKYSK